MKESVRIARFATIGTLNAIITALVIWLMMCFAGEHYTIANIVAYVVAQINNFIWSKYWIFPLHPTIEKKNIYGARYCISQALLLLHISLNSCS